VSAFGVGHYDEKHFEAIKKIIISEMSVNDGAAFQKYSTENFKKMLQFTLDALFIKTKPGSEDQIDKIMEDTSNNSIFLKRMEFFDDMFLEYGLSMAKSLNQMKVLANAVLKAWEDVDKINNLLKINETRKSVVKKQSNQNTR
jgi:hypothetical protein